MAVIIPSNIDREIRLVLEEIRKDLERLQKQSGQTSSGNITITTSQSSSKAEEMVNSLTVLGGAKIGRDLTVNDRIYGALDTLTSEGEERELIWESNASYQRGYVQYDASLRYISHGSEAQAAPTLNLDTQKRRMSIGSEATPFERLRLSDRSGKGALYLGDMEASPSLPGVIYYSSTDDRFKGRYENKIFPFCAVITENLTLTVPVDFDTVTDALEYLADKYISPDATVTISVEPGTYTLASAIAINHPCSNRIEITGSTYYTNTITSVVSASGSSKSWSITLQLGEAPTMAEGSIIVVKEASGGSYPTYLLGAHKVTGVDTVNMRITISSTHYASTAPSGAITGTIHYYPAVFEVQTTDYGFYVDNVNYLSISYLTIKPITVDTGYGVYVETNSTLVASNCAFHGLFYCINLTLGSFGYVSSCAVCSIINSGIGIRVSYGSVLKIVNNSIVNGSYLGIFAFDSCRVFAGNLYITGCSLRGAACFGFSYQRLESSTLIDGCNTGIYTNKWSYARLTGGSKAENCTQNYNPIKRRIDNYLSFIDDDTSSYNIGADAIYVNNVRTVKSGNFRDTIPAAPSGAVNVDWSYSASNPTQISAHVHFNEINHDQLLNYARSRHITHASVVMRARYSLAGGGSIAASRQFYLVNDVESPGANYVYGTNASGVKRWISMSSGGGGGGTTLSRMTATFHTASIGPEETYEAFVTLAKSFTLFKVTVSDFSRVELYSSTDARSADSSRQIGILPTAGAPHGVILDFAARTTAGYKSFYLSPPVLGYSAAVPPSSSIPYRITNLEATTKKISVSITYLPLET